MKPSGQVSLDGQGRWVARFHLANGKQSSRLIGRCTEYVARAHLAAILAESEAKATKDDPSLEGACEQFLKWSESRGIRKTTLCRYEQIIRTNILPALGVGKRLSQVSDNDVRKLREDVYSRLKPSSINSIRVVLVGVYKCAVRLNGYKGPDPTGFLDPPRIKHDGDIDAYSPPEIERLIAATKTPQEAAIIGVCAYAGLRMSELRGLQWGDIDFEGRRIIVRRGFTDPGGIAKPKSGKSRIVPLAQRIVDLLEPFNQSFRPNYAERLVFTSTRQSRLTEPPGVNYLHRIYFEAAEKAGLRRLKFHSLRASYVTMMIRVYPPVDVQHYAGHASLTTTLSYFAWRPQPEAANALDAVIAASRSDFPLEELA